MLFFLRKLIEALFMPIGFSGLLVFAAVIFRRRWIAIAGVVVLYVFSVRFTSSRLLWPLERVYHPMTVAGAPDADAIVVLSGGIMRGRTAPGLQWGNSANRYFTAANLALAGKAKLLVISAGTGSGQGAVLRQVALSEGLPSDHILVTRAVLTTEDEARAISEIPGIHSILLVTSAYHMPRSVLLFRARGLRVLPFPTDERVIGPQRIDSSVFIPLAESLLESEAAMREYCGLVVYKIALTLRFVI